MVCGMNGGYRATVSIFHVKYVSPGKIKKKVEYLRHHSTDFHQVFIKLIARTVADHLSITTRELENVCQGCTKLVQFCTKCTKFSFLMHTYFLKNFAHQISLTVTGNQKLGGSQNSATSRLMTIVFDYTFFLRFPPFQGRLKKKGYGFLTLFNIFTLILQNMILLIVLNKMYAMRPCLPDNFVFLFQMKNWLHGKR